MREIIWSDDALRDFDLAIFYIAKDNRYAATLVADRIEAAIDLLAEIPIGYPGRVKGTYEKPVQKTSYIVAYALSDQAVTILHIIHGKRDWPEGTWPDEGNA